MYTVVYFIQFGKDCQAVFPPNQYHLYNGFIQAITDLGLPHSSIQLNEDGTLIPGREEVIHG